MLLWTVVKRSMIAAMILLNLVGPSGAVETLTITTPPNNLVSVALPRNPINGTGGPSRLIVTVTVLEKISSTGYSWNLGTSNPQLTGNDGGWCTSVGNGYWTKSAGYKYLASSQVMNNMNPTLGPYATSLCTIP